jgi:hypothetical protein
MLKIKVEERRKAFQVLEKDFYLLDEEKQIEGQHLLQNVKYELNRMEEELKQLEEVEKELSILKANRKEKKFLRELEEEERRKATPKTPKKKKEKKSKELTNPYNEYVSIAKDIWKKNPAWVKWEKEHKIKLI